ncbi:MAG: peroxiredoxin [bacterium]|jgi:peroxiredoxin Q/BCP|nr:MAG: peroxiredoxin [bacterium]
MRQLAPLLALAFALAAPGVLRAQERQQQEVPPPLEIGAVAPDFELPAATRWGLLKEPIRLSDYRGKIVVLAFFPRARTSGCTVQMRAYRDQYEELFNGGRNVVLIPISADAPDVLASWAKDEEFPFVMASDVGLEVGRTYGALSPRGPVNSRTLFVVGPDGKIAYRAAPFRELDPTAYEELGEAIRKLLPAEEVGEEGER